MIRNAFKAVILGLLILLCLWQTVILWLGDVSSLNFLQQNTKSAYFVQPQGIWINTGTYTLAKPIKENKKEYERLVEELAVTLQKKVPGSTIVKDVNMDYKNLLTNNGILYEYALPVTLDQIAGTELKMSKDIGTIDSVFLDVLDSRGTKMDVFFINSKEKLFYTCELTGEFELFRRFKEAYAKSETASNVMKYQASATWTIKDFITEGINQFLPTISEATPLKYTVLKSYNPIEEVRGRDKLVKLEEYVNPFFLNPFIKEVEQKENGEIVFEETMSVIVKYNPFGTLEYRNVSANQGNAPQTITQSFNTAMEFLKETKGIPKYIREDIYLTQVKEIDGAFTYYFATRYDGYKLKIGEALKKTLGINDVLEVSVKNGIVNRAKWVILELEPKESDNEFEIDELKDGPEVPIEKMLKINDEDKDLRLDDIECVYVLGSIGSDIHIRWMAEYNGKVYYP